MSIMLGSRGRTTPEINVTPMIDVLLVLLIICMILLPQKSTGESAVIPQPSTNQPLLQPDKPIVIQVKQASGNQSPVLKINEEEVSWQNLGPRLQEIYTRRNDKVAFLRGDPDIDFQHIADVMDIAHHVGVSQIGLMGER